MIIGSVTTISGRLESLIQVLNSINEGLVKPDLILIGISNFYSRLGDEYHERSELMEFLNNYEIKVEIINTEIDVGPLRKILNAYDYFQKNDLSNDDNLLWTFDDDVIVSKNTLENLLCYKNSTTNVLCRMGVLFGDPNQFIHCEYVENLTL
jgi:hypothetical protein